MSYNIEDGKGSRNKATVFAKRMRAFANEASLMNNISSHDVTSGPIGVYNSRVSGVVGGFGTGVYMQYIQNNDPINVLVIDRIYVNTFLASGIPEPSTFASIRAGSQPTITAGTGTPIQFVNENQNNFILNTPPNVTLLSQPIFSVIPADFLDLTTMFLQLGKKFEMIPQGSDPLLLSARKALSIFVTNYTVSNLSIDTFVRFAMYPLRNMD
jgi:hypothetical protein